MKKRTKISLAILFASIASLSLLLKKDVVKEEKKNEAQIVTLTQQAEKAKEKVRTSTGTDKQKWKLALTQISTDAQSRIKDLQTLRELEKEIVELSRAAIAKGRTPHPELVEARKSDLLDFIQRTKILLRLNPPLLERTLETLREDHVHEIIDPTVKDLKKYFSDLNNDQLRYFFIDLSSTMFYYELAENDIDPDSRTYLVSVVRSKIANELTEEAATQQQVLIMKAKMDRIMDLIENGKVRVSQDELESFYTLQEYIEGALIELEDYLRILEDLKRSF